MVYFTLLTNLFLFILTLRSGVNQLTIVINNNCIAPVSTLGNDDTAYH